MHAPIWLCVLVLASAVSLFGCGLPDELRTRAESMGHRIERETEGVETRSRELTEFLGDDDQAFLRRYAESEDWAARFVDARSEIDRASSLFGDEVGPLLEANRSEDEEALRALLTRVVSRLDAAAGLAREPAARAAFLREVRDEGPARVAAARDQVAAASIAASALKGDVDRAARDYPAKADDLAGRLAAVERAANEAKTALQGAEEEARRLAAGEADLARLGDGVVTAVEAASRVTSAEGELRTRVGELYRSYSKALVDMREDAAVEIGRTSWNEAYDFARETERRFVVETTGEDLAALEAWGDRPIASLSNFFGRTSVNVAIDRGLWDRLRIDARAGMPGGDNAAEFWVGNSQVRYFHRYTVVEGEAKEETDWQEVDEAFYEAHYDDLGMDVLSKPYGSYEEEALTDAAPPGLAYVGNPKYGRWENDEQGRRRWSWGQSFLFYHLVFGGRRHYYYHNDWRRWDRGHRGRSAWYGSNDSYGTYGKRTRNSPRYAGSGFGRGGGFQQADRSVRGAGPGGRGGGPGGSGK
jgi:hypothetical protein